MELSYEDYDSSFEGDASAKRKRRYEDLGFFDKPCFSKSKTGGSSDQQEYGKQPRKYEYGMDEYRKYFSSFNAFDRHKILINQYLLYHPGSTSLLIRDTSKDKTDIDVLKENHKFIWEENASIETWGKKLAKKYYDKLFKEYCICDLSWYKTGQVGMRWRTDKEVIDGKGQFSCGEKHCSVGENLRTWEMNFGYVEDGLKKNALVKLRLCHDCSYKINYKHRRKEIRNIAKKTDSTENKRKKKKHTIENEEKLEEGEEETPKEAATEEDKETNIWKEPRKLIEKDREDEFEDYLQDMFL